MTNLKIINDVSPLYHSSSASEDVLDRNFLKRIKRIPDIIRPVALGTLHCAKDILTRIQAK